MELSGVVQGVGFRPTVYRLARQAGLGGWIQNRVECVRLVLEGPESEVRKFLDRLREALPPRARLDRISWLTAEPLARPAIPPEFEIRPSASERDARPRVPPDMALCPSCRAEVLDLNDRRYGYPFTTCCDCGPRYTVIEATPYDRVRTTLRRFPLCSACRQEYEDPTSRRYHAESIACPACGPRMVWTDAKGRPLDGDPLRRARAALADGAIVAIRGLGGFLLSVDAQREDAVRRLRKRKRRPAKPLATMAPDLEAVRRLCLTDPVAETLLTSPEAPIVILDPRPDSRLPIDGLSPDTGTLGVMLPTTALHLLLAVPLAGDPIPQFDLLVMTSGNRPGAPILTDNADAVAALDSVADFFLLHDRDIHRRADDSLSVVRSGRSQLWRRARGYAPAPIRLVVPLRQAVLAMGGEMKNTIAIADKADVYLSPHIGDLESPEAVEHLRRVAAFLPTSLGIRPAAIAVDCHPDYHSTRLGEDIARQAALPLIRVQHHHAHAAAVLAEHGCDRGMALAWDGTGWGDDGTIWGAELLYLPRLAVFQRLATFEPCPLPGGDAAVAHPIRQIVARWADAGLDLSDNLCARLGVSADDATVWARQSAAHLNAIPTHAAGRVFDAVAAALGLAPDCVSHEGQTAMRLEHAALRGISDESLARRFFELRVDGGLLRVDWRPLFRRLHEAPPPPAHRADIARSFHSAMAMAALAMAVHGRDRTGCDVIGLTGGVFMNRLLHDDAANRLSAAGFRVLIHGQVPPNDGGIAFGQAVIAGAGD